MEKVYWEIEVDINPVCSDVLCNIIQSNFECEGIITSEESYKNLELVKKTDNILKAYIVSDTLNYDEVKNFFLTQRQDIIDKKVFNEDIGSWSVRIKKQEIEDWSKKWKEHWKPSKISKNIVICPTWENYVPLNNEIIVNLDPGNAFGTGTHATTQLCVKAIEKFMVKNSIVADIGTGSGILSVCAVKLGAKHACAIDIDDTVLQTAIDNATINKVNKDIDFEITTIDTLKSDEYDFVTANILHNVLADIMPNIKRIMKQGSIAVLSGILQGKEPVVVEAVKENNMKIIEKNVQNEWIAYIIQKEN